MIVGLFKVISCEVNDLRYVYEANSASAVLCDPGNYTKRRYPLFLTDGYSLKGDIEYFNGHLYHVGLKKVEILAGSAIISNAIENTLKSKNKIRKYKVS